MPEPFDVIRIILVLLGAFSFFFGLVGTGIDSWFACIAGVQLLIYILVDSSSPWNRNV
jgi:hypothetical protein